MKLYPAALMIGLIPAAALAQTANISTTELTTGGFNTGLLMQDAVSNTYFRNDGYTVLALKGGSSAVTATLVTAATSMSKAGYGAVSLENEVVSIPANATVLVGPFPTARWNSQYGTVHVSLTSVAGVSASAIKVEH